MKKILTYSLSGVLVIVLVLVIFYYVTSQPEETMRFQDPYHTERPTAQGSKIMVASGHPLATKVALEILEKGGNAADAGVAALLVLNVTQGEEASFPGVAPLLYYDQADKKVHSYIGVGTAPAKATIEYFKYRGHESIPMLKYSSQLVPASPDVIVALLKKYGTRSFEEVSKPAIQIAEEGFPVHRILMRNLNIGVFKRLGLKFLLPYNAKIYVGDKWWKPLHPGEKFKRPALSATLKELAEAEKAASSSGKNRADSLEAVRDYFYKGPIADKIAKAHAEHDGTMVKSDLARYSADWEVPLHGNYGPYTIFSNRTWNQGAVVPIVLQILEGIDLKSMGHNSKEYVHTVVQAIELAMADREKYFGDPAYVSVPEKGLLSKEYAAERRKLLQSKAFGKTPPPGDPFLFESTANSKKKTYPKEERIVLNEETFLDLTPSFWERTESGKIGRDTTYLSIIDSKGNSLSLTPSDFPQSPIIEGDITLGIRMTQFRLDPNHPSSLVPGKRPTITPNASMVFKDGKFWMSFGTPGGDMQTQAVVQVFLNIVVFGMNPQDAVNAPRFRSLNWPDAFSPHKYYPGRIELEEEIYRKEGKGLEALGYEVKEREKWEYDFGAPCISLKDPKTGILYGGADPRKESWAEGK
ncbi:MULTISPECIES: gamma-glutamyltransferase family protein [unclassified Leptospira]|uniref:gamma-glutamyltransferase family protein n=1 Tax=unclassified Leptospira TaxID=2633828 RepID=UPI0002C03DDF|nr:MULTISPECIES: gamma-glutamyltransferase family protein [unclassified Leptospira]EMK00544.1 putative gamma-glutamyltransferase [Leptospira sp. B5-022]MCR1793126.1 gamma-glutamyltransferase family protein [Leptospira sp. id769339]